MLVEQCGSWWRRKVKRGFFVYLKREEIAAWVDGNENHLERERKHWGCARKRWLPGTMILCVRKEMALGRNKDIIDVMDVETHRSLVMVSHFLMNYEVSSWGESGDRGGDREASDDWRYETVNQESGRVNGLMGKQYEFLAPLRTHLQLQNWKQVQSAYWVFLHSHI